MKRRRFIVVLMLAGLLGCGKKGRPKRLDGSTTIRIHPEKTKNKGQS